MRTDLAYDSSIFIRRSIDAVFETIAEAVVLVVLVIFFFLRSLRATLIPLVTIPVSLVGAFALMYAFGFSINTLTCSPWCSRSASWSTTPSSCSRTSTATSRRAWRAFRRRWSAREIGFAVLAMTVTLASVYAPIGFMTGRTGLFTEFAWRSPGAVLVSGFALSLSPMMSSKMLRHVERHGALYRTIESGIVLLTKATAGRSPPLEARWLVVLAGLLVAGSSFFLFTTLKSELAPTEDRGTIVGIGIAPEARRSSSPITTPSRSRRCTSRCRRSGSTSWSPASPWSSQVISFSRLVDWEERERKQQDVVAELGRACSASGADGVPGQSALARPEPGRESRCSS